jgi:histidine kinase
MFEKVDANQAIRNTLAMTSVQLHRHHIFVHLSLDEEGCPILGNLTKMEQVIMNLVSNARDAVNEREKNFRGKIYLKKISLTTRCDKNHVFLIIEDNGTGIRPEQLGKLFNPFFTTKPPGQGTGLGLSIVYGIITEMKGTIDIKSKMNKFTRIMITLPKI